MSPIIDLGPAPEVVVKVNDHVFVLGNPFGISLCERCGGKRHHRVTVNRCKGRAGVGTVSVSFTGRVDPGLTRTIDAIQEGLKRLGGRPIGEAV